MGIVSFLITILGLCVFEIVSSVDNAIINAEVLSGMQQKAKKWFLSWGIILAVFVMRGLLPWIVIYIANPSLGFIGALVAGFSPSIHSTPGLEASFEVLLMLGGTFLILLFLHWLFLETKEFGLKGERFFQQQGMWFYALASIFITVLVGLNLDHPVRAFGVVLGSTIFFITHGFKQFAEQQEIKLDKQSGKSDLSKLLYLEAIDASFSIDGVFGAFAFTFSVPLIFLGNGIGAIILRKLTISNIEKVKKYKYLKNGAMYSIFALGIVMVLEGLKIEVPSLISPAITFFVIGYFYLRSKKELNIKI
jgi:uncharacterized protein